MSRSERRDLVTIVAVAVVIAAALVLVSVAKVSAGKAPPPSCWWDGTTLRAVDLPDEWSVTRTPTPVGVSNTANTFTATFSASFTAYFWTRGGPYAALFKPGPQYNDYKPVCVAVP